MSEYTEGRILLLSRDLPGGDYVLKFVIYDQVQTFPTSGLPGLRVWGFVLMIERKIGV